MSKTRQLTDTERAVRACLRYEHWAIEVTRLTAEIAAVDCPQEEIPEDFMADWPESHFKVIAGELLPGMQPDDGPHRRSLDSIQKLVAACPECYRLCDLIRDRKHARQRYGVAKRRVRHVGKMLGRVTP